MSLIVLEPGLESRVVDFGRPASRGLGVPVGGAADRRSFVLGNVLLGNDAEAPALEIALKGPRLRAEAEVGAVLFGAPFDGQCDGYRVENGRSFTMKAGQELHIGGGKYGARVYLCVRGGFASPRVLASRSALAPLQKNDVLRCVSSSVRPRICPELQFEYLEAPTIGVLPGLQASWFEEAQFYSQSFTVTPASNRMGLRLAGRALTKPAREMASEPACPGAVQVTHDGQCIVLGVDGQTIGGYPKIAHVIQADLDALGQLRPGQLLRFAKVSLQEAMERDRAARADLRAWALRLSASFEK